MGINFTPLESAALYELLAENTPDIFLKTDCKGFVQHASPAIGQLGLVLPDLLIGPHIADLAHPDHAGPLRTAHDAAIRDRTESGWLEIPAVAPVHRQQWFEIRIRPLANSCQQVYGAISVMRSIDERRCLEEKLFTAAMTDPLTGLTNRRAFIAMLQHLIDQRIDGCLAVFDIDHFRAINMQYGQFAGDDVLVIFAELVRDMMRQQDIISRIGGESLGVMLPGAGLVGGRGDLPAHRRCLVAIWPAGAGQPGADRQCGDCPDRRHARRNDQAGRDGPVPRQGQGPQPAGAGRRLAALRSV